MRVTSPASKNKINFQFENHTYEGLEGDSIAAALLANGVRTLRYSDQSGEPRGIYCGIGHCYECRVYLEELGEIRSCITPIQEGMVLYCGGRRDGDGG